jgi:predicted Zn-dependent protease
MLWFGKGAALPSGAQSKGLVRARLRRRPCLEGLETRDLKSAVAGVDYLDSGYQWANPSHITYSIVPDGVQWDHGITNLNAAFNAKFGNGSWQRAIAEALATWESVANVNIAQVADSGLPFNTPGLAQGDPRFGDIRFAGYPFSNDTTTLARTYFPPPDTGTGSGDDEIDTTMNFNLGTDYDLYSVMLHETGLALGLAEVTDSTEVMYGVYTGIRSGLAVGDLAGIQGLYGPRTADVYQQQGQGLAVSSAIDLTSELNAAHQLTLNNPSLATIGDTEYFSVVAPAFSGATLEVTAAASNISLLSPQVSVLSASGQALDVEGNPNAWGDNVTAQVSQIVPGQRYIIAVTGATQDDFAVGAYQLDVLFAGDPSVVAIPPVPPPAPAVATSPSATTNAGATAAETTSVVPIAPSQSAPHTAPGQTTALGTLSSTSISGLSPGTGSGWERFTFKAAHAGVYQISAPGTSIRVLGSSGKLIVRGAGWVTLRAPRARTSFLIEISPPGGTSVAAYSLSIHQQGVS